MSEKVWWYWYTFEAIGVLLAAGADRNHHSRRVVTNDIEIRHGRELWVCMRGSERQQTGPRTLALPSGPRVEVNAMGRGV